MKKGLYFLLGIFLILLICNAPLTDAGIYPYEGNYPVAIPKITENAYGEMWNYSQHSNPWIFNITEDNVYFNLTNLISGNLNGFNFTSEIQSNGGSYLIVENTGLYSVSLSMSFLSNNVGGTFGIGVVQNFNVANNRNCYARREASMAIGNMGIVCLMDLNSSDTINIQVENEDNTRDMIIHTVNLNLVRIGD